MHNINNVEELEKIFSNEKVIVDFHAKWCRPCKELSKHLVELEKKYTNIAFVSVDVDESEELSEKYNIESLPTLIFFYDGMKREEIKGLNLEEIKAKLASF